MPTTACWSKAGSKRICFAEKTAFVHALCRVGCVVPDRVPVQPLAQPTARSHAVAGRARGNRPLVAVASAAAQASLAASTENPFVGAGELRLLTPSGSSVSVQEVTSGKVVVALLRHLGCLFCWEQALNLLRVRDQITAAGYKLVVVAIGSPEGGQQFSSSLPFPQELLLLDPDRHLYSHLQCFEGFRALFSADTWEALKARPWDEMKPLMERYKLIRPKDIDSTTVMGGIWVLDDGKVLYGHRDPGLAAHAPMVEVLTACCGDQLRAAAAPA